MNGAGESVVFDKVGSVDIEKEDLSNFKSDAGDTFASGVNDVTNAFACTVSALRESFLCSPKNYDNKSSMAMRNRKSCEPLGPVYLLRSVRDQVALFQERRGVTPEENNFVNLLAIMLTQTGQAVYGVFTMFLSLLPAAVMFLHVAHFLLDRILDLVTTRKKNEFIVKLSIFCIQIMLIYLTVRFVVYSIFLPILSMQTSIVGKIFLIDHGPSSGHGWA